MKSKQEKYLLVKRVTDKKYQSLKRKEKPEVIAKYMKKYYLDNQEKFIAHRKVAKAIKNGVLLRKKCRDCTRKDTHAHHFDYSKPLEVIWLCPIHHKREHIKNLLI